MHINSLQFAGWKEPTGASTYMSHIISSVSFNGEDGHRSHYLSYAQRALPSQLHPRWLLPNTCKFNSKSLFIKEILQLASWTENRQFRTSTSSEILGKICPPSPPEKYHFKLTKSHWQDLHPQGSVWRHSLHSWWSPMTLIWDSTSPRTLFHSYVSESAL